MLLALALLAFLFTPTSTTTPEVATETQASPSTPNAQNLLAGLPSRFEPNVGQAAEGIAYTLKAKGYLASLSQGAIYFALPEGRAPENFEDRLGDPRPDLNPEPVKRSTLTMSFAGANPNPAIEATDPQEGTSNYFLGNDPSKWQTNVPGYSKIYYRDLYDGIDMVIYDDSGQVRYDFIVAPGADPAQIEITFEGAENLKLSDAGDLVVSSPHGDLTHKAPYTYQGNQEIDSAFEPRGERAGFRLGDYDHTRELTIDPALAYSSYLGGSGGDEGYGIAVDSTGAAYLAGLTLSTNFPTAFPLQGTNAGSYDTFVTKVAPSGGSLIYSSYLGGSSWDIGTDIKVDSWGAAYLLGYTWSTDLPTSSPFQASLGGGFDAFVTKVAPSGGSLAYSSYLGGSADDIGTDIELDSLGAAYVTGHTGSTNFPTVLPYQGSKAGATDAFVTKVAPSGGSLAYSTYLGGTGNDYGEGVAVDSSGAAYLTGWTYSADFPTVSPLQAANAGVHDAFVTKVAPDGDSLAYSTFLGGGGGDLASSIAVDSMGAAYLTGWTDSAGFPTVSAFQGSVAGATDAFVTKVAPGGGSLAYSSYLGGASWDYSRGLALDFAGAAYVTGETQSTDFPLAAAFQGSNAGGSDAFVTKVAPSGGLLAYSTYLGGSASEIGYGIAVDLAGAAYIAGHTYSTDFPAVSPFQGSNTGFVDAFATKVLPSVIRANTTAANAQSAGPGNRPDVSNSGNYVAFHSPAGDLIAGDTNGVADVFLKAPLTGTIERVSVATDGTQGNGASIVASMSPDSRYVTYFSQASNLVPGDTNGVGDVFLRDRTLGTTERISIATDGTQANGASRFPQVSPNGRYVVFQSEASNLVAGDTNGKWDIFLRDRTLGTTERISVASDGTESDKASARPSISDDGNLVTYHSWATNLVAGDTNGLSDVFVRNRSGSTTARISVATDGTQGNGESQFPKISGNGAAVVFHSMASNLVTGDTNGARDVFGRVLGTSTTERVSLTDAGTEADNTAGFADISDDGRYVVFHSTASNLVAGDTNAFQDIFVRDRITSATRLVSTTGGGGASNAISGMSAISADGAHAAYQSQASNLVAGDTNAAQDIFYTPRP